MDINLGVLTCCVIFEFLFLNKCTNRNKDLMFNQVHPVNRKQFQCSVWHNEISSQVVISQFGGVFRQKNAQEQTRCSQEYFSSDKSSIVNVLLGVCKMEVRSLKIATNENTELSNLNYIERHAGNITELSWEIDNECRISKLAAVFKHKLKVLTINAYSSLNLENCDDFSFNWATKLTKLHININKPHKNSRNLGRYAFDPTFLRDTRKLQQFKLNCGHISFEVDLPRQMFQGLINLSELTLEHCSFNNLSALHFEDLTKLRVLNLSYARFDDFEFLRCVLLKCV